MNKSGFWPLVGLIVLIGIIACPAQTSAAQDQKRSFIWDILDLPVKTTDALTGSVFDLGKIVVTPTRTAESTGLVASDISVFTVADIEARGTPMAKTVMEEDLGSQIVQEGSYGGNTSIFLRGANSGQTRIMIDGVRMYDPVATNGAFNLTHLPLTNTRQVEVVRGPSSSLYGSDAIGGVVNIITERGSGKPQLTVSEEAGSFYSHRQEVDLKGEVAGWGFAGDFFHWYTKGISSAEHKLGNPERDPYENYTYSARVDRNLGDSLLLSWIGRYTEAAYEYDNFFVPMDNDNLNGSTTQYLSSFILAHEPVERVSQKLQISQTGNLRRDWDDSTDQTISYLRDWYAGETLQVDYSASWRTTDAVTLLGGFNYLRERAESYRFSDDRWGPSESVFPKRFADSKGYFVEARVVWFEELVTTGSFRIEDHSNFGTQDTWKVDAVYHAGPWGTKLRSAYGTGFKAPSLYQLYAPADPWFGGGNASLKPETSSSYEFGVEQPLWKDSLTTGLTYFNSHFANLIDAQYHPDTWLTDPYANIGKARSFGFELPLTYTYSDRLRVKGSYTWTDTENLDNHRELLRRAKNKIGLNIDCYPADKIKLRWDTVYYGSRYDSGYQKLKGYSKTDFNIAYQATPQMEIYVRFENLFAAKYEEAKNYGTPGFGVFGGVKLKY